MKLLIGKDNILKQDMLYLAKDIMEGQFSELENERSEETQPKPIQESYGEVRIKLLLYILIVFIMLFLPLLTLHMSK